MSIVTDMISANRLGGEPCPRDLAILATDCSDLLAELGITISTDPDWAPWADKSYLTPEDYANPDIAANVKAIDDTFEHIRFVAQFDDGECVGYWVGPDSRPIAQSPIVCYDNGGQFTLYGGRFVESLFFLIYGDDALKEIRSSCADHNIPLDFKSLDDIRIPATSMPPSEFHEGRYYEYLQEAEQDAPPNP